MTTYRALHQLIVSLVACSAVSVGAQGLRPPLAPSIVVPVTAAGDASQRSADYIVAIVNSEPITNHQVRLEMQRVVRQLAQAQQPVPEAGELAGFCK